MEVLLGLSGVLASVLGLVLAFYMVFVDGGRTKEILREVQASAERQNQMLERQGRMLERQGQMLGRIEDTLRYVAELVRVEGERTREEIKRVAR